MASAVTPFLAKACRSLGLKAGERSPTRIAPFLSLFISASLGASTFSTRSAFQAADAVTIFAPAFAYSESGKDALAPAPFCTTT